jgi:cystathionine beta-lyase
LHTAFDGLPKTAAPVVHRGSTVLMASSAQLHAAEGPTYGRGGLTTHATLRQGLCDLEQADDVTIYPSGLSAITGSLLALTAAGDEVLAVDCVYGPTRRFLNGVLRRFGVSARYFPATASASDIETMLTPRTRLIFLEAPGSLTMDIQDVPAIAKMARRRGVLTVIDNTWSAGVCFKPLDHGVDVSLQALTKYICGHSDVFMGMAAARGDVAQHLHQAHHDIGWTVSADDAYLALRGLRSLYCRMAQHDRSARTVATWLAAQAEVRQVLCPALPSAPGHALWQRDYSGVNGLFSVVLEPAAPQAVDAFLDALELFGVGYSWGGYESLILPADPQLAARSHHKTYAGPLIRLHIGLETPDDLIGDLRRGLDALAQKAATAALNRRAG